MDSNLKRKSKKLNRIVSEMGSLVLAFSGGADSTLLAKICLDALPSDSFFAAIATSPIFPPSETRWARKLARNLGITHTVIETREMENKRFLTNQEDHCYLCKKSFFRQLKALAKQKGFVWVSDGTSFDDIREERQSFRALEELKIRHPLAEAKLTKPEIRELSKELSLPTWDRFPQPCLASRLSLGVEITIERMQKVAGAERWLQSQGFTRPIVRYHQQGLAQLKLNSRDMKGCLEPATRAKIMSKFRELGFSTVALALEEIQT